MADARCLQRLYQLGIKVSAPVVEKKGFKRAEAAIYLGVTAVTIDRLAKRVHGETVSCQKNGALPRRGKTLLLPVFAQALSGATDSFPGCQRLRYATATTPGTACSDRKRFASGSGHKRGGH